MGDVIPFGKPKPGNPLVVETALTPSDIRALTPLTNFDMAAPSTDTTVICGVLPPDVVRCRNCSNVLFYITCNGTYCLNCKAQKW